MTPIGPPADDHRSPRTITPIYIEHNQHRKQRARKKLFNRPHYRYKQHSKRPPVIETRLPRYIWSSRASNTSIPMSSTEGSKKRSKAPTPSASNKKSNTGQMDLMEVDQNEPIGPSILSARIVHTNVNTNYRDVLPTILDFGGTADHTAKSCIPFTGNTGTGGVAAELHRLVKIAAKATRFKGRTPSKKEESEVLKKGLRTTEWLTLASTIYRKEKYTSSDMNGILTDEEIVDLLVFLNRMAYTPPTITCTKVRNSQCTATSSSSCWAAAKQALGSHYHKATIKKQKKLNIATSLKDAEDKKRRKKQQKENPSPAAAKRTEEDSESSSSSSESVSSTSSDLNLQSILKHPKAPTKPAEKQQTDMDIETSAPKQTQPISEAAQVTPPKKAPPVANKTNQTALVAQPAKTTDNTTVQSTLSHLSKPRETADQQATRRKSDVRLQLVINMKNINKESPAQYLVNQLNSWYTTLREADKRTILMPWKRVDSAKLSAINTVDRLPKTFSEWVPYIEKCRPKPKIDTWVKIRVAGNLKPEEYTSLAESKIFYWYDEHLSKGFLCPVQKSDRAAIVGYLLYSGPFIDPKRVTHVLEEELTSKANSKEWLFSVRVKKCTEMPKEDNSTQTNWLMADNQIATVIADTTQTKLLHNYLQRRFGKPTPVGYPGGYNFRYMPAKDIAVSGAGDAEKRKGMFTKHQAVLTSLRLRWSEQITALDKPGIFTVCSPSQTETEDPETSTPPDQDRTHTEPSADQETEDMTNASVGLSSSPEDTQDESVDAATLNHFHQTCRQFFLSLKYPLVPAPNKTSNALIHTIDWAATGQDAGKRVYFTAYEDRIQIVEKIIGILPEFIRFHFNDETMTAWCGHQVELQDVEFHHDDEGNWLGTWTTADDRLQQDLLDEDMGYKLEFDNLQLVEKDTKSRRRILRADDASIQSFHVEQETHLSDNTTKYDPSVAAASVASGGSGVTN